jgi:multicomponent Na+:H+ antiporter subunit D
MILPLFPLSHIFLGLFAIAWKASARATVIVALIVDIGLLAVAFSPAAHWLSPTTAGGWSNPIGIPLVLDSLARDFILLAVLLELAVAIYLWRQRLRPTFVILLQFLVGAVMALVLSQDLFNIYVILELLTLVSFLLVAYDRQTLQIWASLKYLILASVGMSIFLFGIAISYVHVGSLSFAAIGRSVAGDPQAAWIPVATALLVAGVSVKAGILTFSLWLPDAHSAAPASISAFLSGLVIKMGVVVLIRLAGVFPMALVLQILGGITGIGGAIYAMSSKDLKRMLAFHTLSQIGYLLIGMSVPNHEAANGVLAYALAHGSFKALLFLAAGAAYDVVGSTEIAHLIRERHRIPLRTRAALLLGTLAIVGLPPFDGYLAKAPLLAATVGWGNQIVLLFLGIGTAASFSKLLPLFKGPYRRVGNDPAWQSYIVLALPIVLFLPIERALFGAALTLPAMDWLIAVESVAVVAVGWFVHRLHRRWKAQPSERLFRLEPGMSAILLGFVAIYLLLKLA